jgi:ribosomal protein S18 acetylase RimI-like enzyme
MKISPASKSDASEITSLHYTSGVQGLLGKLSKRTLEQNFYGPILENDSNVCLVAKDKANVLGFLFFRHNVSEIEFNLPTKNLRLILNLISVVIRNPFITIVVFNVLSAEKRALNYLRSRNLHAGELQILIVDKAAQSQGIGRSLLDAFQDLHHPGGIMVKTQSRRAMEFYQRNGFRLIFHSRVLFSNIFVLMKGVED